jgi:NTE family protein
MSAQGQPVVGIALSGGIAKVIAHIGVLRALTEAHVPIHAVSATSGGAVIGAFFAAGHTAQEMEQIARSMSWKKLATVTIPKLGLLSNAGVEHLLNERLAVKRFEDLPLPFAVVGANLSTGRKAVFTRGEIAPAVRASTSIPQLFTPVVVDGDLITDGALAEYLPVETLVEFDCDLKIGVNLGSIRDWHEKTPSNIFEIALRTTGFVSQRNAAISEKAADFVIRPDLTGFGPYELHRADELLAAGYEAGTRAAPLLLGLIAEREAAPTEGRDWSRLVRWLRRHSPLPPGRSN